MFFGPFSEILKLLIEVLFTLLSNKPILFSKSWGVTLIPPKQAPIAISMFLQYVYVPCHISVHFASLCPSASFMRV